VSDAHDQVGDLASTIPQLRGALEDFEDEDEDAADADTDADADEAEA
jgi:hypothetical protein